MTSLLSKIMAVSTLVKSFTYAIQKSGLSVDMEIILSPPYPHAKTCTAHRWLNLDCFTEQ